MQAAPSAAWASAPIEPENDQRNKRRRSVARDEGRGASKVGALHGAQPAAISDDSVSDDGPTVALPALKAKLEIKTDAPSGGRSLRSRGGGSASEGKMFAPAASTTLAAAAAAARRPRPTPSGLGLLAIGKCSRVIKDAADTAGDTSLPGA